MRLFGVIFKSLTGSNTALGVSDCPGRDADILTQCARPDRHGYLWSASGLLGKRARVLPCALYQRAQ